MYNYLDRMTYNFLNLQYIYLIMKIFFLCLTKYVLEFLNIYLLYT